MQVNGYEIEPKANLSYADLGYANPSGVDLKNTSLSDANLSWESHDLIAEVLLRAAEQDPQRRSFAGLILVSRDWCWDEWVSLVKEFPNEGKWAFEILSSWKGFRQRISAYDLGELSER